MSKQLQPSVTTIARALTTTEGTRHQSVVQTQMVSRATAFRQQLEQDLLATLDQSGFTAADQNAAFTTVIAAVKAVLW